MASSTKQSEVTQLDKCHKRTWPLKMMLQKSAKI